MDQNTVQLSIILTTHSEKAYFEQLLDSVLILQSPLIEVIVINDAADSSTGRFIHRTIKESHNSRVFVFEHEQPCGRGLSLNEALIQASGSFIWAPLRAQSLHETLLSEALRRFGSDPAVFWSLDHTLPENPADWITAAENGLLPDDSCLVWNRDVIRDSSLFFNPFLKTLHGAELALRLYRENIWHQTDPFFVIPDDPQIHPSSDDLREILYTAFRFHHTESSRHKILEQLAQLEFKKEKQAGTEECLLQSRQLLEQGNARGALEAVNLYLVNNPQHPEANRIKVSALEKLRRHVEAAEHKHGLQKQKNSELTQAELFLQQKNEQKAAINAEINKEEKTPGGRSIKCSVVIPTAGLGKQPLETTLLHLEKAVDPESTELIIVDNASIDDTFDYLEQLQKEKFLNISVLTQPANRGFGASVNTGIEECRGEYILILHNDVMISPNCPEELMKTFEQSETIALAAPVIDPTEITAQSNEQPIDDTFILSDRADSCCFMIRSGLQNRFDESYQLCHFDMDDFCKQITQNNQEIVINRNAVAEHQGGATTAALGIKLFPQLKWKNREYFNKKWGNTPEYEMPGQGSHPNRFEILGPPDNPANPDPRWVQTVQNYLTDEVKTEILRTSWDEADLTVIVSTLLIAEERELLRTLEDRLDDIPVDPALLILFVQYYFSKNIYSRCKHYLEKAGDSHPVFDLYRLKIMVAEKEPEEASLLLNKLLKEYPACPELFQLAGDVYRQNGDEGEAKSFYAISNQLDPYRYAPDEPAFEIKF